MSGRVLSYITQFFFLSFLTDLIWLSLILLVSEYLAPSSGMISVIPYFKVYEFVEQTMEINVFKLIRFY